MAIFIGYHGTTRDKCRNIFKCKRFYPSRGDKHWLGDGVYFYLESFFAYRWCVLNCKNKMTSRLNAQCIIDRYSIIEVDINVEERRIFNIDGIEHKSILMEIYEEIKNLAEMSSKFKNVEMVEGVVLNYLFSILHYDKDFDIILATFPVDLFLYKNIKMRHAISEMQICVRNGSVINNMREFDFSTEVDKYNHLWGNVYLESDPKKNWYFPKFWA